MAWHHKTPLLYVAKITDKFILRPGLTREVLHILSLVAMARSYLVSIEMWQLM